MGIFTNSIFPASGEAGNGGGIIQIKFARKNDTFSQSLAQGNESNVCMSVSMACQSSSNKVIIFYSCNMSCDNDNRNATRLTVDGTAPDAARGDAYGNGQFRASTAGNNSSVSVMSPHSLVFVHEPNDTNSHTYGIQLKHGRNNNATVFLNRASDMGSGSDRDSAASFMLAMEVSS